MLCSVLVNIDQQGKVINNFCYNELSPKPGFNLYKSRHCAYITYIQCENLVFKNSLGMYLKILNSHILFRLNCFFELFIHFRPFPADKKITKKVGLNSSIIIIYQKILYDMILILSFSFFWPPPAAVVLPIKKIIFGFAYNWKHASP